MNNYKEAKKFAEYFQKKNGIFTYSGEMALEISLNAINVNNKKVIMPNNVCHSILLSVLRSGGIPIIVNPYNGFVLSKKDLEKILKKYDDIASIILVHQFGIKINVKEVKEIIKNRDIKIIEDIAQSWGIEDIGDQSDYVVTSFGKSKQLSFGIGGGIFSNDNQINKIIDSNFRNSRQSEKIVLPYILPKNIKLKFNKLKLIGNKNVKKQIFIAKKIRNIILDKYKEFECFYIAEGVWNRYPIWTKSKSEYLKMIDTLNKLNIKFELPYKNSLEKIPFLKNHRYFFENYNKNKNYIILLKTRKNSIWRMLKWKHTKIE